MFILELYFLLYRVPKMMTRLARERGLSALRWSLLGIGAWLLSEFAVIFGAGLFYGIGVEFFDWPMPVHPGFKGLAYLLALVAALLSTTFVSRILMRKTKQDFPVPPLPPEFSRESQDAH
jgi:Kef-type K+ transport system membrane component KefB